MDTLVSDDNWAHDTILFFVVASLIIDVLIEKFLIHIAV